MGRFARASREIFLAAGESSFYSSFGGIFAGDIVLGEVRNMVLRGICGAWW